MLGFESRSQIDKFGERLAGMAIPSESDLQQLQTLRMVYDEPMASVAQIVAEKLGLDATSRLKTVNTIVEKLKRERTRLSTMQDIAGLRIVKDVNLAEQDVISRKIADVFASTKISDRRQRPSFGYRAVHVIVKLGDCFIEVQVRTYLQDLWAQGFEKVADRIGRGIRYGAFPTAADERSRVAALMEISREIANVEQSIDGLRAHEIDEQYLSLHNQHQTQKDRLRIRLGEDQVVIDAERARHELPAAIVPPGMEDLVEEHLVEERSRSRYFLVVYNRREGRLLEIQDYQRNERERALKDRFSRELKERADPDVEVVLLGAESREALGKTHARYFKPLLR